MRIIDHNTIKSLNISPKVCIDWICESFRMKSLSDLPAKISVHPADSDFFTSMPCLLPENDKGVQYFGIKEVHRIVGCSPSLGSDMMLYNAKNGELLALIDCDWITTMRTGAVAALSSYLLRKNDTKTYGFIGLGNTARATLLCILEQEPNKYFCIKLLKYKDQADLFIERFASYKNINFQIIDDVNQLCSSVDVLISCITDAQGLICEDVNIFKPGITIIPVHMRGFQNCDCVFDRVLGDDTNHVKNFKYFNQYNDYNEIGEVLLGNDPGRRNQEQRIIDYNYGLGLHDVVFASKIYELIIKDNIQEICYTKETSKFWL